jgi:hypothetical protein
MRTRRAVLLGLLGLAAGSAVAAGTPTPADVTAAHTTIAQCARRAGSTLRGLDALRRACPGVAGAVRNLGLDAFLPVDWVTQVSAPALADLEALAERYSAPAPALRLSASRLQAIAAGLKPPPSPPSLWERIRAWIRSWLGSRSESSSSWLRFLPHWNIGPRLARLLFVILAGLVVIAAGVLVAIELRAAGLVGAARRPRTATWRSSARRSTTEMASSGFADLDSAAPHERPALLLGLLVQALTRSNRLRHDRDLTCRELIAQARFDTGRQRASFGLVALLAERALYGGPQAAAAAALPDEVLSAARALHAELLSTPAAGAPATAAAETV